jgi:hypothetical protein
VGRFGNVGNGAEGSGLVALRRADHLSKESCCMIQKPHSGEAQAQPGAVVPLWWCGDGFSVIVTSGISVEGSKSHVRSEITMLQYKCSLLASFLSFLTGNFLMNFVIIWCNIHVVSHFFIFTILV